MVQLLQNIKNISKFKHELFNLDNTEKIYYKNTEYIISQNNNLIPKSLSDNCKLNGIDKKNIKENRFNLVKQFLTENKNTFFLKKYNLKNINNISFSAPDNYIERVNLIVTFNGIDYYGNDRKINVLFYVKNTNKSSEVNILPAKTFVSKSPLKKQHIFLKNLLEFEKQKFSLIKKDLRDIFFSTENINSYIKNHSKSLIRTIIPNADYLIDINDNNEIFVLEVSELITRYSSKMKKQNSKKFSVSCHGLKIINDLFNISLKDSGKHPEYFKICINKKIYKKIDEFRKDSESNRSQGGANSYKNGKEYENFIENKFYVKNGEKINNFSILFLDLLKINHNDINTLNSFKYISQKIKPDILVKIEFNNGDKQELKLSVKSSNKSMYGHLSGHSFKSFKKHMNEVKSISKDVDQALNNFFAIKSAKLLSVNDKKILKEYFSTNIKELFNFTFVHGNREEKAEYLVYCNNEKKIIKILKLQEVLNYYLKNNLFDVDFSKQKISIMSGLILLEARSSQFQFHFSFKNLNKEFD